MRNLRNLVQDYVDHMGYNGHEEVNRIMLMVDSADHSERGRSERGRIVNVMLDATTKPYSSSQYDDYEVGMNGIPHL